MTFLKNKPNKKTFILQSVIAAAIVAIVLIVDLTTKTAVAAAAAAAGKSRLATVIDNFFYITYTQNYGAAWSIGGGNDVFMTIVLILTFVAVAAFLFLIFVPDSRKNLLFVISLALITGGATGNLVDRLYLGYVRDFLDFYIFGYNFPIFNVADSGLVVGVILLIICILVYFFKSEKKETSEPDLAEAGGEDKPE